MIYEKRSSQTTAYNHNTDICAYVVNGNLYCFIFLQKLGSEYYGTWRKQYEQSGDHDRKLYKQRYEYFMGGGRHR